MNDLFSFQNIYRCYLKCRRKKRNTANALRFETHLEDNICKLEEELKTKTYQPARSVCFVAKKPKFREVFAADFRDRVVHHILVSYLERIFEPVFIYDSWACRVNKGTQAAVKRLRKFTRSITSNGTQEAFYLQLDIKSFFVNINKDMLSGIVSRKTDNSDILWLLGKVLDNDCTKNYVYKGNKKLLNMVPPHKTLFNTAPHKGLPIGNLTSQFFANVYLNELDQFVKHNLKAKYYLRYVDDFILLSGDKEQLTLWKAEIEKFLREKLDLELNPKMEKLGSVSNGIDFLGYIVRPAYMLVRRRVVNNCKSKLALIEKKLGHRFRSGVLEFPPAIVNETKEMLASYLAHFALANSHNLIKALGGKFGFVGDFWKYSGLVSPHYFTSKMKQYNFFKSKLCESGQNPVMLFFQSGCFYEFYGTDTPVASGIFGLNARKSENGLTAGFPLRLERKYAGIAAGNGCSVYVVRQMKDFCFNHKILPRVLTRKYDGETGSKYEKTQ